MTNYNLKVTSVKPETTETPTRKISEKRKKRLALLTRIEVQRIKGFNNWLKKNSK